ncbi:MAG: NUDIX hydrolase [Anaerolineales bacterium]|nr:NUDIX hydrolase [Anaerolineales bacterium]
MTEKRIDYILELRCFVGHRPLILAGAAVLIFNDQDQLLLGLRPDNHCWGIPGGGMEPGEQLEETALRETHEETGLEVGLLELFGVFSGPDLFYEYPNGDQVYNVTIVYRTHDFQGVLPDQTDDASELHFFALDELPENLSPPIRPVIEQLLAGQEMRK